MYNASECNIFNTVIANISNVNATCNAYGVYLHSSNYNTFDPTEISDVNASYTAFGLYLGYSNNNSFTVTEVSDVNASYVPAGVTYGIYIYDSGDNRFSSTNVSNINATHYNDAYGIRLYISNNNSFNSSTSISNLDGTDVYGIYLDPSNDNDFNFSTVYGLNASNNAYGIYLLASSGNTFVNSTICNYSTVQNESYGLSDPELERQAVDRLSFMNFIGFPEDIPDFTTDYMVFRERLAKTSNDRAIWTELQRQLDAFGLPEGKARSCPGCNFYHHGSGACEGG